MLIAEMLDGPLKGRRVRLDDPRAYHLFFSHKDIREHWFYYRINPLDSSTIKNTNKEDLDKEKENARRILAAKPGKGSGLVNRTKRADITYKFVKEVDETYRCVVAMKEKFNRDTPDLDIYTVLKFKDI